MVSATCQGPRVSRVPAAADPGLGPSLHYVTEPPLTVVQCRAQQVYPEPRLAISVYTEPWSRAAAPALTTTTLRRGLMYDVAVNTSLATAELSLQTVFSCTMEIPGTQFFLKEDTMYSTADIR